MRSNRINLFLSLFALMYCGAALAERSDIVYLHNGDRVTGEVKGMERGLLEFKTDRMGTLYIEWEDIREIISKTGQSVELTNGQRFYGTLEKPAQGDMVLLDTDEGQVGLDSLDVITMYPVESDFWDRLDFSVSLGFSWDKASSVGKYNVGFDSEYRRPDTISRADFSTEVTTQENNSDTTRSVLNASHSKFLRNKRFRMYFGNMEHNDELGIDLRTLIGVGYGWVPIRSQHSWFLLGWGLDVNHEIPLIGESETNLEALFDLSYEYFRYTSPERALDIGLRVFPSLTSLGRVRADFNTTFRLEFVKDLFWSMELFVSYDSDPISEEGSSSDYGIISSLGYKF
jgi:hypothetical protein